MWQYEVGYKNVENQYSNIVYTTDMHEAFELLKGRNYIKRTRNIDGHEESQHYDFSIYHFK